jgi:hypothetical protein
VKRTIVTRAGLIVTASIALAMAMAIDACVIADPPTELPQLGEMRPTIVRASVAPSMSSVLGVWPDKFIVPVEMSNPQADLAWATFVDFDPVTGFGIQAKGTKTAAQSSAAGGGRMLELAIAKPNDNSCHIVEIVVALRLPDEITGGKSLHTPPPPGGDTAMWVFNLSGDLAGCPVRDAGISPEIDGGDAEAGSDQ